MSPPCPPEQNEKAEAAYQKWKMESAPYFIEIDIKKSQLEEKERGIIERMKKGSR